MYSSIILALSFFLHPFYLSLTEIKDNPTNHTLEISIRIFTDDFEKTLKSSHLGTFDLTHPKSKKEAGLAIDQYLNHHFYLEINGKKQILQFIGFETEENACWNYFQIINVKSKLSKSQYHIHNDILYEVHVEQMNLINFQVGGEKTSVKLEYPISDFKPLQN